MERGEHWRRLRLRRVLCESSYDSLHDASRRRTVAVSALENRLYHIVGCLPPEVLSGVRPTTGAGLFGNLKRFGGLGDPRSSFWKTAILLTNAMPGYNRSRSMVWLIADR